MDTSELIRHMNIETARSYAEMIRALEWLLPTMPVHWPIRWFMRFERWLYGRLLDSLIDEMPVEDRAAALVVAPEEGE